MVMAKLFEGVASRDYAVLYEVNSLIAYRT